MRPPPDCRPSVGASAPKGTCRWLSPFGGSVVRTALNYNYHRAAGRILCRRLKYATGYLLKLTPPSCKKASPAPIRTMKVRGNENWSEKSSISTREASPAPIRTMKVRANENWSEISTRKASPAPIRTMKVRGNENWYPIRTIVEKKLVREIVDQPRVPPYSVPDVGSDRGILSGGMTDRLSDRPTAGIIAGKFFRRLFRRSVLSQFLSFCSSSRTKIADVVAENGRVMRGMTLDSSRPWGGGILGKRMAVGGGIFGMRPKYRDVPMGIDSTRLGWMVVLRWKAWIRLGCPELSKVVTSCGFLGVTSSLPFADVLGNHLLMGSGYRLVVTRGSRFCVYPSHCGSDIRSLAEYFGGVGERLMFLGQLNVRRMSGDRIASVCRLRARAPNYLPPILLSYFTGDVTLDDRIRGLCCVPN
ncbi:hypothetical protein ISN45_Un119g000020 [Arabidopsis thaliana x Arabidopsis arenosa]|uniref:Uncharacterized protein n=1 Tax=Arabidopsis thaliana x Arabidopsis arenosa TaxID=1240361 RepID=A0A8T1X982_9BRAS|nr:hypothetical protein ISN45_Un119g000020 [Arabidopsis thaliana x Arabidopsis arenosa]